MQWACRANPSMDKRQAHRRARHICEHPPEGSNLKFTILGYCVAKPDLNAYKASKLRKAWKRQEQLSVVMAWKRNEQLSVAGVYPAPTPTPKSSL